MGAIDNRIVQMVFDNAQFEKGVKTTMNSLSGLDNQINSMDKSGAFDGLAAGVDAVASRFSNLGIVGMSIIQNLTNRVVDMGIQMTKSITVDQVAAGMKKYESITTNTISLVNQADISYEKAAGYIEKLAWYSDATSFSLSDMVTALQAFARQGIDLDKAIPTIMGIGNSVTYAGQSAIQGSRAFDIYADSLAKGGLTLMEWRRLGMLGVSTAKLKQQFLDAAVAVGTLRKESENTYSVINGEGKGAIVTFENFERTLTNTKGGWANYDVINKVFGEGYGKYTNDLADATLEYQKQNGVILSLDEAMDQFGDSTNKLGKIYLKSATQARTFSEAIDAAKDATSTAFYQIFQSIFGAPEEAIELWTGLNDFLVSHFSQPIVDIANAFSSWHDMGEGGRTLLLDSFKKIGSGAKKYLEPVLSVLNSMKFTLTGDWLYEATSKFNRFADSFERIASGSASDELEKLESAIADGTYEELYTDGSGESSTIFGKLVEDASKSERFQKIIQGIADALDLVSGLVSRFIKTLSPLKNALSYAANGLLTIFSIIGKNISVFKESNEEVDKFTGFFDVLGWIVENVSDAITKFTDLVVGLAESGSIGQAFKDIFDFVGELFNGDNPLKKIFDFFAKVAQGLLEDLSEIGKELSTTLTPIFGGDTESGKVVSGAVLIGLALKKLLNLKDAKEKLKGLKEFGGSIKDILANIAEGFEIFIKRANVAQVFVIASAIGIITASLVALSNSDPLSLVASLAAIVALVRVMYNAFKDITKLKKDAEKVRSGGIFDFFLGRYKSTANVTMMITMATGVLILAVALKTLTSAFADVGDKWPAAVFAFLAITAILAELVIAMKYLDGLKGINVTAKAFLGIAGAVAILAVVVALLGRVDFEYIKQGIGAVTALLVIFGLFVFAVAKIKFDKQAESIITVAGAMLIMAVAIDLLAVAVAGLAVIGWTNILVGLGGMLGILVIVGGFSAIMKKTAKDMIVLGAALTIFGAAFLIIAGAILVLSAINLDGIATALLALIVVLTLFGVLGYLFSGIAPQLLLVSAAMLVMSLALLAIAGSISVFAGALAVMAATNYGGLAVHLLAVAGALAVFVAVSAILSVTTPLLLLLAAGVSVLGAALLVLGEALIKINTALLLWKGVVNASSTSVINDIQNTENVIGQSTDNIEGSIQDTTSTIEQEVKDAGDDINSSVVGSSNSAYKYITGTLGQTASSTGDFGDTLRQLTSDTGLDITKITEGTGGDLTEILKNTGGDLNLESINIGSLLFGRWVENGKNIVNGIIEGVQNLWGRAKEVMINLGNTMAESYQYNMGIYSPSRVFMRFGEYIDEGLIIGLQNYEGKVEGQTKTLGDSVISAFAGPMAKVASLAESDLSISPKITPVIDASNIQNGQKLINSMFANGNISASINGTTNANISAIGSISNEVANLKNQIANMNANQLNEQALASILVNAMRNVDINMDGSKVGRIITNYQMSANRAAGL